jgi:hypothetical protein
MRPRALAMAMLLAALVQAGCGRDETRTMNTGGNDPAPAMAQAPADLASGVCPIDAAAVSAATGVDMHADPDADCVFRGPDGVELVTARVTTGAEFMDGQMIHANQGYEVVDLGVGEDSYLAMREVEAIAESVYGDLLLSIHMAGFEADEARWRAMGTKLLEESTGD